MKRILFILTLLALGLSAYGQTGSGWYNERKKENFKDSIYFSKDVNFLVPYRIGGTTITSNAQELNILDGGLITFTELNSLLNITGNVQTQLNSKQATLVSGTSIKTINGESLLGSGNIDIDSTGTSMVYPGTGIALSNGSAWTTSITNNSVNWDTAYVARNRWNGGSTGLTAATGRTSLGGTTIGQSIFTLTNPSAITFPRFNADNTVTALSAANYKTALSLAAADVGLGNVTNESKATMFTSPFFTGTATMNGVGFVPYSNDGGTLGDGNFGWSDLYLAETGSIRWDNGLYDPILYNIDSTIYLQNTNGIIIDGNGTLGTTLSRVKKGWFTDLTVTNTITGTASAVTGYTRNAGSLTLSGGHGITLTTTGTTGITLPTSGTLATTTTAVMRTDTTGHAVGNYMPRNSTEDLVNDSIAARIAAATVGVALADSNIYVAGYATPTFVDSRLGSGGGLSAERLPFIIGTTTGAPTTADSTIVHTAFTGKHIDLYRDGAKQYQNFTATNTVEGFRVSGSTITVYPLWQDNEQVLIDIIEPILWSYLSLSGEESTLLDSLRGYWKLDEPSGTIVIDAAGIQNGTRTAGVEVGVTGKLGYANRFNLAADVINIPYNTNVSPKGVDCSIVMWFWLDSIPSLTGHENYLFQQNVGSAPWAGHYIYVNEDDDKIYATSRNTGGTQYEVLSTGAISDSTWYHVVLVNPGNGQDLLLYLNGVDVSAGASRTFSGTLLEGLSTTCFGSSYEGSAAYHSGIIDSPGIWGRVLTSGEVTTLYNSGNGKAHPFN